MAADSFAYRLRSARRAKRLTLDALSARTNPRIHPAQLSRLENGLTPSIDVIVRLARALDIEPRELALPVIDYVAANRSTPSTVNA